jgi:hypothetical protein
MMTVDEAEKRLDRPISELRRIDEQTNEALGWANHDQQPAPDQKA